MKFIQITATSFGPYNHPNGDFRWGDTALFALDDSGRIWRNDAASYDDPHWHLMPNPIEPTTTEES